MRDSCLLEGLDDNIEALFFDEAADGDKANFTVVVLALALSGLGIGLKRTVIACWYNCARQVYAMCGSANIGRHIVRWRSGSIDGASDDCLSVPIKSANPALASKLRGSYVLAVQIALMNPSG